MCGQAPGHIDRLLDEGEQVLAPPNVRVVEQRRADLIQDLLSSKNILYMYVLYVYYTIHINKMLYLCTNDMIINS